MKAFPFRPDVNAPTLHSRLAARPFHRRPFVLAEPPPHRFDYAGVCRAAREEPGNFVEADSHTSGVTVFAIGDTESVPDPMPLLCVRHYLRRSHALPLQKPLLAAAELNGLIYDCCTANCFLSSFYAQLQPATKTLHYVNAGHDAPILIRTNPDEALRLESGGPVFGLQESPRYLEGALQLKAGDRLVAFTSGVINSLAAQNRGSVESVLVSLVRNHCSLSACQLANLIVAECEDTRSRTQFDGSVFVASVNDVQPLICAQAMETDLILSEA